jgi:hypothetical protein
LSYEFDQANLISQQISRPRQQSYPRIHFPDFPVLDLDVQHSVLRAVSANNAQLFIRKKTEIATQYLQPTNRLNNVFSRSAKDYEVKHTINLEKKATKPTPEVQRSQQQSIMLGRVHKSTQAHKLHEQTVKIQVSVTKQQRTHLDTHLV